MRALCVRGVPRRRLVVACESVGETGVWVPERSRECYYDTGHVRVVGTFFKSPNRITETTEVPEKETRHRVRLSGRRCLARWVVLSQSCPKCYGEIDSFAPNLSLDGEIRQWRHSLDELQLGRVTPASI